ncbi:PhzF family phenazine biosynthesis protein [Pedobacter sp. SYP-B3415]|uniref:PhzF family phenazine biosynthesis protein n=1 Tax=Pedobacter sp. SYP-B3415 TaxID=2496641 RepID=UPI00101B8E22|nr:PhzF family phenazine biosynthesis protein [Pedobacter sp. SYP-B3415]
MEIKIVNAFTSNGAGGNPAGIVLNADDLSLQHKQRIASQAGVSETVFISSSEIADFKLDFFTPSRQIAHCGHATIAAFSFLQQLGKIDEKDKYTKETIDGCRDILLVGDKVFMQQNAPKFIDLEDSDLPVVAKSLQLVNTFEESRPLIVDTGNSFLIIRVPDENVLRDLRPDYEVIATISEKYGLIGYYVFSTAAPSHFDATTRMFAPAYGILEEAATGMAAGPLACYLFAFDKPQSAYLIEQGKFMETPSKSLIQVDLHLENGKISKLFAGGNANLVGDVQVDV